MRPVQRAELLDWASWTDVRETVRPGLLAAKAIRRVPLGEWLTLLVENRDTVRYQVQEMMRVERIVREADIAHELHTYNELLGGPGEIGATLLIGIDDEHKRDERLRRWLGLNGTLFARLADGEKVRPTWDARQVGTDRLSSVQYLRFAVRGQVPVAFGCDHPDPEVVAELTLSPAQQEALEADLAED